MSRKITKDSVDAFYRGEPFSRDNTRVEVEGEWVLFYLHGQAIARRRGDLVEINHQGWRTVTTKDRLNAILRRVGGNVWQERFAWYWSGPASDGKAEEMCRGWTAVHYEDPLIRIARAREEEP